LWWVGKRIHDPFHLFFPSRCPVGRAGGASAGLGCEQNQALGIVAFPAFFFCFVSPGLFGRGEAILMMFLARFWRRLHTPVFGFSGVPSGACPNSAFRAVDLGCSKPSAPPGLCQSLSILSKGRRSCQDALHLALMNGESCLASWARKPLKHGIFVGGREGGSNFKHAGRSTIGVACCCCDPPPRARQQNALTIFIQHEEDLFARAHIAWLSRHWTRTGFRQGSCSRDGRNGKSFVECGLTGGTSLTVRCHESNRDHHCSNRSESSRPYTGIRELST
jgi:hypothetical protein